MVFYFDPLYATTVHRQLKLYKTQMSYAKRQLEMMPLASIYEVIQHRSVRTEMPLNVESK